MSPGASTSSDPRGKLRKLYDRIQDTGLFIAPEQDIKFGIKRSININNNGTEKIDLAKEGYNSSLLFTMLTGILKHGNMIYFGPPGAGKTTAPEFVGHFLYDRSMEDIHRATIFCHPEQTQELMVARYSLADLMIGEEKVLVRECMTSPIKILDEINRLPPGKLSILYQLVDRGFTDYGDEVVRAGDGPMFMTANAADEGNYPLPKPFLDRIGIATVATYLNPCYLGLLEQRGNEQLNGGIEKLLDISPDQKFSMKELELARHQIRDVSFSGNELYHLIHFLAESNYCFKAGISLEHKTKSNAQFKKPGKGLCSDCHYFSGTSKGASICYETQEGISPRSYKSLLLYSKAMAWWRGKKKVDMEDLEAVLPYCTWHKLTPTDKAFEENSFFVNDRSGFASHLFEKSKQSYLRCKEFYDLYDTILQTAGQVLASPKKESVALLQDSIAKHLENLKKIDSVSKYPIAVTLARAYNMLEGKNA